MNAGVQTASPAAGQTTIPYLPTGRFSEYSV